MPSTASPGRRAREGATDTTVIFMEQGDQGIGKGGVSERPNRAALRQSLSDNNRRQPAIGDNHTIKLHNIIQEVKTAPTHLGTAREKNEQVFPPGAWESFAKISHDHEEGAVGSSSLRFRIARRRELSVVLMQKVSFSALSRPPSPTAA